MAQVITRRDLYDVQPWELPQMKGGESAVAPRVRSGVEEAGFQAGYQAGLKLAQQRAYDDARLEMATQFCAEWEHKLEQFQRLIGQLEKPLTSVKQEIEGAILTLIEHLVLKLTRKTFRVNQDQVIAIIREALQLLPVKNKQIQILMSARDRQFFTENMPDDMMSLELMISESPELKSGDFRVVSQDSEIDGTLRTRLDALIAQMTDQQQFLTSQVLIEG